MTTRKPTRQQMAIADELRRCSDFTSAQDLHARLRSGGSSVGLATVYRTLQALAESQDVDVLRTEDGEAIYRHCSSGHHHHLVCKRCGKTLEVEGPAVEAWAGAISAAHGFRDVTHHVEIFGLCPQCQ